MTTKYLSKQIEVEAVQFTDKTKDRVLSWAQQIQQNVSHGWEDEPFKSDPCVIIPTLEGEMKCSLGDYIIVEPFPTDWRKLYPVKNEIFVNRYEEIAKH